MDLCNNQCSSLKQRRAVEGKFKLESQRYSNRTMKVYNFRIKDLNFFTWKGKDSPKDKISSDDTKARVFNSAELVRFIEDQNPCRDGDLLLLLREENIGERWEWWWRKKGLIGRGGGRVCRRRWKWLKMIWLDEDMFKVGLTCDKNKII